MSCSLSSPSPSPSPSTLLAAHSDRYDQALLWAAQLHRNQFRKGKPVPYISHLISVSAQEWLAGYQGHRWPQPTP